MNNVHSNTRATWKVLNEILNRSQRNSFEADDREITDPVEIANKFYSYFSSIGPNLVRGIQSSASHRTFLNGSFTQLIFFNPTTQDEIAEIAKTFLPGKETGSDHIPMIVSKKSILHVSEPLTHIINLSIQHGIVPDEMKMARVITWVYS